ncbi:MAG: NlpC/P60 family protein [Butyricicoccus sp.]|nr:NlpC/P60 family protein [Butyricicoccus sp.]
MKNSILKTLALCLAIACLLAVPASADTIGGGTVSADALNLRAEPSLEGSVKLLVPGGAFVLVEEQSNGWSKIAYNGVSGYVSSNYISFAGNADGVYGFAATVAGNDVRMRSGPSTSDSIIGRFDEGAALTVTGVDGNWLKVATESGAGGYIRSDLLSYAAAAGESAAAARAVEASLGEQIVATAKEYLGYRYVWGGMSPAGFDCSGFVNYVYKQHGYSMNRVAQSIYSNDGVNVEKDSLQPGDLVFFGYSGTSVTHVGLYIGDGQMIHASTYNTGVIISDLSDSYYTRMYVGAKRII